MNNKNSNSGRRGLTMKEPDKRKEATTKDGASSGTSNEIAGEVSTVLPSARGFAAMDEEKRKQIARRGGSVSRRNRLRSQENIVIL